MNEKIKPRSKRRTIAGWQALFCEQAESGLSIQAFCTKRGIGYSTFSNWKSRLASYPKEAIQPTRFVELSPHEELPTTHWDLELVLGADIVLRFSRH